MAFEPTELFQLSADSLDPFLNDLDLLQGLLRGGERRWRPILSHGCDFPPANFEQVCLNLAQNPNITSTHLFRADILYDSDHSDGEYSGTYGGGAQADFLVDIHGLHPSRTIVRRLIPRNPQLDRPIEQTWMFFSGRGVSSAASERLVVQIPHVEGANEIPWYHPSVKALAYYYKFSEAKEPMSPRNSSEGRPGLLMVAYELFDSQVPPLPKRLIRTAHNLLSTLYRHGQGELAGYRKRVHHDQIISQQRVQDTYAEVKRLYAKRLCEAWVEKTEPSKHVFEDLGIAAFLIEVWRDMYRAPEGAIGRMQPPKAETLPQFPGFVDIGCGNGVLTEILLLSGYHGWGFDARERKTWSILSSQAQESLYELVLEPAPLFSPDVVPLPLASDSAPLQITRSKSSTFQSSSSLIARLLGRPNGTKGSQVAKLRPEGPWKDTHAAGVKHDGLFPKSTFIISNHADELTPWTPLLAYLSESPFLMIPCCSHNLSGQRFRAPSVFNSQTADHLAPRFFESTMSRTVHGSRKAVMICTEEFGDGRELPADGAFEHDQDGSAKRVSNSAETGDLKKLSPTSRVKQPSAYASLCDWVEHLAREVGYRTEKEMLRIPSTRNTGMLGRWTDDQIEHTLGYEERWAKVTAIVQREAANRDIWRERCNKLRKDSGGLVIDKGR